MISLQIPLLSGGDKAAKAVADSVPSIKQEVAMLKTMPIDDVINRLVHTVTNFAINLAIAVVVFYVGKFVIKKLYRLLSVILTRREVDRSLTTFVLSLVKIVLYFILIVTVIGIIGIETSSFIALFASAGVAIGMALSGTLQNFAGGVLILLLKPYKIGDYIEAQGYAGTVREIQIFSTIICTPDNKSILIPNGSLSTGSVNNWSREDYRRVDWTVSIAYGDDIETARRTILDIFAADSRVVKRYLEDDRKERQDEADLRRRSAAGKLVTPDSTADGLIPVDRDNTVPAPANLSTPVPALPWYKRIFRRKSSDKPLSERIIRLRRRVPRVDRRPVVVLDQMADSAIVLKARAWTRTEFYWDVYYQINEQIYTAIPKAGLSFPFPQLDVHLDK